MKALWNKRTEEQFFKEASKFASPEQLFYKTDEGKFVAYWPKGYKGKKSTLQSRNALIGKYSEKWSRDLISLCIEKKGLYAIQGAICNEISLTKNSPADIVISKTNNVQLQPEDILMVFEVKMSIVWNWMYDNGKYQCIGDYRTHQGNPGLLRSDSMLKAIGKSINIRVSNSLASKIPIIVLGNTPIAKSYYRKVDHLKSAGIIQGFWSLNPNPIFNGSTIKHTPQKGFYRFDKFEQFQQEIEGLLTREQNFFSSMKTKVELGKIITIAAKEPSYEAKAEKFLTLLRENE
ncbi:MAG: hypothetical protein D6748_07290 [Calditrichaeota bacterium]|nr:MAG: hypothetical protein D6748_07290 [Calditrichota bacterium]